MKRLGLIALLAAGLSCGPPPNLLPVNDLDRPTDVAFMCFGAFASGSGTDGGVDAGSNGTLQVSGRPLRACHPPGQFDPGPTTTTRTFAFMPNSASGTLTAVDADHWKLVDLDPDTAGYGTVPLGQDPEQISVSDDGCRLVSANRGSCDLTVVDPSALVAPMLSSEDGAQVPPSPSTPAQTFRPIKGDGTPLVAAPYEVAFLPQDTSSLLSYATGDANAPFSNVPPLGPSLPLLPTQNALCAETPAVDLQVGSAQSGARSWYVLVTYPSCDLVAVVALPSGKIVSSAKVVVVPGPDGKNDDVTLQDAGINPSCPVSNCAGQVLPPAIAAAGVDAAATDGAPVTHALPGDGAASDMSGAGGSTGGIDGGSTGGNDGGTLGNQVLNTPYLASPLGPSGIAIVPDGTRAYISLANASYVLSVGLNVPRPGSGPSSSDLQMLGNSNSIYLNEGARGSTRIRLSVDPTRQTKVGQAGVFVGAEQAPAGGPSSVGPNYAGLDSNRKYLYAIARDGTLRVIQVAGLPGTESECETNADPLNPNFIAKGFSASKPCIPVARPSDPPYRRPFSVGPGIHFPSLPIDVAAADIQRYPLPTDNTSEQTLSGAYAWVITDSGTVYLVNINPILRDYQAVTSTSTPPFVPAPVTEAPPFINTLRDKNQISYSVLLDSLSGPPRVDVLPTTPPTGPYLEPFWTRGSILNATALNGSPVQTIAFFPQAPLPANSDSDPTDRRAITPQTWTISWEGPLGGQHNSGNMSSVGDFSKFLGDTSGLDSRIDSVFQDGGANYCQLGVLPGDLVTLVGCINNAQCGIGEQCLFGNTASGAAGLAVTGICVDPNQVSRKQTQCNEFLNSVRRYRIDLPTANTLVVEPNLDEIVISPLKPECQPTAAAAADAGIDAGTGPDGGPNSTDTCPDSNDPTTANFTCESKYPGGGTGRRCLMRCKSDSDCRAGRTCIDFTAKQNAAEEGTLDGGTKRPCDEMNESCFCADAPIFDDFGKECFDQLISYQVTAGQSFLVTGSQAGLINTAKLPTSPGQLCSTNPTPDARFTFRIPISGPSAVKCTNVDPVVATIDSRINPGTDSAQSPLNDKLVSVVTSPPQPADPCLYLGGPAAGDPLTTPAADGGTSAGPTHVRALFKNSQLSFVLANLDRSPTFQTVISFDVHGGFVPQTVIDPTTIEVSMPARIVLGPVDSLAQVTSGTTPLTSEAPYLFVVDQRRLGFSQGGGPTRGQLLRINPFSYNVAIGVSSASYLPIFEDYNATGGLFPIQ